MHQSTARSRNLALSHPRALSVAIALACLPAGAAHAASYAPWLLQIGVNDSVMSAAKWGTGQTLGVVDTGIIATHPVFAAGQVSQALSGCAAVTFRCSSGVTDDNGHGTAVAAIAAANATLPWTARAGGYTTTAGSVISVAPNANIVAEKVLNAAGTGTSADVAAGVRKAADAGAGVINVSITYGGTADIVSAINYATAKGAFVVWAGGNSSQILLGGARTTGLTPQAINHLLFVGSVNAANTASSFTNKPGGGLIVASTGVSTPYTARWLMAPGEAILAPAISGGNSAWAAWSGTSMAAPIISGSLILLQNAWPILRTNGTTANLLLATTTDLGTAGTDTTYGRGLANLAAAFQPYGTLTVTQANGQSIPLTSLSGKLISSGALGALASVKTALASYTALDSYARNFTVNLSALIASPSGKAQLNPLPANPNTGPRVMKLADGRELGLWLPAAEARNAHLGEFAYNAERQSTRLPGFTMLTDARGDTTVAAGYGLPAAYGFTRALLADDSFARLAASTAPAGLERLAQGGAQGAFGTRLSENLRLALAWQNTAGNDTTTNSALPTWMQAEAQAASAGLSYRLSPRFTAGITVSSLDERHSLLGARYESGSAMGLNDRNRSIGYGASLGVAIDARRSLLLEASTAQVKDSSGNGLLAGTRNLRAQAWGISYLEQAVWQRGDRLTLSLKQPLRVSSGEIGVSSTAIDDDGLAHNQTEWVRIAPDGRETDLGLAYAVPVGRRGELSLQAAYRKDAGNLRGEHDAGLALSWNTRF